MAEFCDLYDENRNPLGRVHNRADEMRPGEFINVVGVWVFNSQNHIMLTKRHPDKKPAPNLWENTGGYVMSGETGKAAAVRELREETGIAVTEDELRYIGSEKIHPFFNDDYFIRKDLSLADIILQEGETSDVKWVTYEEFLKMSERGELAPFIMKFFMPIRDKFLEALSGQ
jgi:8-oxo-dGTP pyrophosphatase MutT (NUDIX family)